MLSGIKFFFSTQAVYYAIDEASLPNQNHKGMSLPAIP